MQALVSSCVRLLVTPVWLPLLTLTLTEIGTVPDPNVSESDPFTVCVFPLDVRLDLAEDCWIVCLL